MGLGWVVVSMGGGREHCGEERPPGAEWSGDQHVLRGADLGDGAVV